MPDTFVGCLAKNTSDQTAQNISGGVFQTYSAEDVDTDNAHSTVTNTGRITIPASLNGKYGIFTVAATYALLDGSPLWIVCGVRTNGTTFLSTALWGSLQGIITGRTSYVSCSTPPMLL